MSVKCASNFECGHTVDREGDWCFECQERVTHSPLPGDAAVLAMVPNLDPMFQLIVLNSPAVMARMQLARRSDLQPQILHELLRDQDGGVVFIAAGNRAATRG